MDYILVNGLFISFWYLLVRHKDVVPQRESWLVAILFQLGAVFVASLWAGLGAKNLNYAGVLGNLITLAVLALIVRFLWAVVRLPLQQLLVWLGTQVLNGLLFLIRRPRRELPTLSAPKVNIVPFWTAGYWRDRFSLAKVKFAQLKTTVKGGLRTKVFWQRIGLIFVVFFNPLTLLFLWQLDFTLEMAGLIPNASYDVVDYHGPMIGMMLQNETIAFDATASIYANFYPRTIQLLYLWQIFFDVSTQTLRFTQVPFFALTLFALYTIQRHLNVSRFTAYVTAALVLFFPVVLKQLSTAYIDIAQASLFISAVALGFISYKRQSTAAVFALGIALGLMAGAKSTAFLYFAVVLALYVSLYFVKAAGMSTTKRVLYPVIVVVIGLSLGTVWVSENHKRTGNPFYPIDSSSAPVVGDYFKTKKKYRIKQIGLENIYGYKQTAKLSGWEKFKKSITEEWIGTDQKFRGYDNSSLFGGAGPWPLVIILPCLFWVLMFMREEANYWQLIFILIVCLFPIFFQPLNFRLRFILGPLLLTLVFVGVAFDYMPVLFRGALYGVFCAIAYYVITVANLDMPTALRGRSIQTPEIISGLRAVRDKKGPEAVTPTHLFKLGYKNHPPTRAAAAWVDKNKIAGKTIYVNRIFRYPSFYLWDRKLTNRIIFYKPGKKNKKPKDYELKPDYIIGYNADTVGLNTKKTADLGDGFIVFQVQ